MTGTWLDDLDQTIDPDDYGWSSQRRPAPIQLDVVKASTFAGKPIPERQWLVGDWVPDKAVTILSGDGGVGKSLIAMQLGVAVAAGTEWLGTLPSIGPVLYVSAEDDRDEIHRRLVDIVGGRDDLDLAQLNQFHVLCLAGQDAVMATSDGRGIVNATDLWRATVARVREICPRLLVLDNLADVFAGNENARAEARQFVGQLRGLAIECDLAVLLVSHPSLTGISSGTGTSGSTAWSNSVRSRLYLDRAKAESGDEPDPDLRILRLLKANYGPTGTEVRMRWERGRFKLDGAGAGMFDRIAAEAQADRVFLELVTTFEIERRDVSANPGPNYAPTVFSGHANSKGLKKKLLKDAMDRLFAAKRIRTEVSGPPSRRRTRLVLANE